MNCPQSSDFKLARLEEEIIWKNERKDLIKDRIEENLRSKSKKKQSMLNGEWFKVSIAFVSVGLLCFILFANIQKSDFQGDRRGNSENYYWHNLEIKPVIPSSEVKWAKLGSFPLSINFYKNFDIVESQKRASFKIMRPKVDLNLPLEVSRGAITYPSGISAKNFNGPISYWDIWHKGDTWVTVHQSLAEDTKQLLNEKGKKVALEISSDAKVIPLKEKDAILILSYDRENDKRISMYVKNKNDQVIYFQIRGNISEEKLINLARSYIE